MKKENSDGLGTQLRRLLELLDGDLEKIYRFDGHRYRPRYTPVMKALCKTETLSIKEIASLSSISHSAASQTIEKMVAEGFVQHFESEDSRERLIGLSRKGRKLVPLLQKRWKATQLAAEQLDNELSMPLSVILSEAITALNKKPFVSRIANTKNTEGSKL